MRQYIIEPIFGHLKFNVGYRNFLLRGIEKVSAEFKLMCIGWNLKKMLKLGIKSVRIQDKMVQIKYMLIWQLQILLKREENYDPVEKLKLIPDRFQKSPLFYKISFFFCLVDLYSRTTCKDVTPSSCPTHFIGLDQLIKNKTATGREQDMLDAKKLKQLKNGWQAENLNPQ